MPLAVGLFSALERIDVSYPERRLICEVIQTAKADLKHVRFMHDAHWFFHDSDSPFSDYCAHLGLNAIAIRAQVLYGD